MSETHFSAAALAASAAGPPVTARIDASDAFVVRGPDAGSFLHGQLAADISGLTVGRVTRSLLLNHRGHAMAEAVVARDAREWLVIVEDGMTDWVGTTLAEHIIFDDVNLSRAVAVATLTLQGSGALAALRAAVPVTDAVAASGADGPTPGGPFWRGVHAASGVELVVYPRRRSAAGGFDLTLLVAEQPQAGEAAADPGVPVGVESAAAVAAEILLAELVAAGALGVTATAIDAARVAAGVSTAGRDGGAGVLPQEAALTGALSYRKGCYLGQEVMARIEARGNLKRSLATVEVVADGTYAAARLAALARGRGSAEGGGLAEAAARSIELNGRKVGVLGTAALMPDGRVLALAVLRSDLEPGAVMTAGGLELRQVHSPPLL